MLAKDLYLIHCLQDSTSDHPKFYSEFDKETTCSECNDSFYFLHVDKKEKQNLCAECFGNTKCSIIETLNRTKILIEKKTSDILFMEDTVNETLNLRHNSSELTEDPISTLELS